MSTLLDRAPRPVSYALAGILGLGLASGLAACSEEQRADEGRVGESGTGSGDGGGGTILQPGRPGESNETLPPDTMVEAPSANVSDVAFMQMMVPHHAQALEMSELARTRARDEQVLALARRIHGGQGPEIVSMASWLQSRGVEVPESTADLAEEHGDHAGHGGGDSGGAMAMHGMLSAREMSALEAARGREFDRLFLAGMIRHHEGAVAMAREEMESGADTLALELAADVAAGQQAEIRRMLDVRRRL